MVLPRGSTASCETQVSDVTCPDHFSDAGLCFICFSRGISLCHAPLLPAARNSSPPRMIAAKNRSLCVAGISGLAAMNSA